MKSPVVKRSIVIAGHKTSVSLEDAFWRGLKEIARAERTTLSTMVSQIDKSRQQSNLSSAIRLFVLDRLRVPLASFPAAGQTRIRGDSLTVGDGHAVDDGHLVGDGHDRTEGGRFFRRTEPTHV